MEQAVYEIIEDEGIDRGEIPCFQGGWAHRTLEGCRRELQETLGDWLALRLRLTLPILILTSL
jgi:hypothetical protein